MRFDDPATDEAFREVAEILAASYLRHAKVRCVPTEAAQATVNKELANRAE